MDDKYIGKLLDDRYEILDIAGVGGMAVVYKARDRALGRYVAIKMLKEEFAQDEEFRRRFYNESQTVARLSHHNIVSIYDVSHTEGLNYIVMELVDGITLKEYLQKKGRLSWQEALFFAQQIARALEHAHGRGIIHQDIKPHNIMILRDATAKVTDFGIARFAAKEETRVVKEAIGSVHYISPEQAKGSSIDYRTDLYSLGVVMYEMLTGKLPFDGDNALAIVMQHISAMPLMPSEVVPNIPRGMNEIVMHAMCPNVSRRYSSATELYNDLERLKSDPNMTFHYNTETRGDAIEFDETQKLPNFEVLNNLPVHHTPVRPVRDFVVEDPFGGAQKNASAYEERRSPPPDRERELRRERERERNDRGSYRRRSDVVERESRFGDSTMFFVGIAVLAILLIGGVALFWFSKFFGAGNPIEVPNFVGSAYTDIINNETYTQHFHFVTEPRSDDTQPENTVLEQDPVYGTQVEEHTTVTLYYASSETENAASDEKEVVMEDFIERDLQVALDFLEEKGFKSKVEHDFDEEIPEGRIIRTTPRRGQTIMPNEEVLIVVSDGPDDGPFEMPNYFGRDVSEVTEDLTSRGLSLKSAEPRDSAAAANTVIDQDPAKGEEVQKGDEVTLYYSSGTNSKPDEPASESGSGSSGGDTQDPDVAVGTGSISVALPPQSGEAQVVIKMSGNVIHSGSYDTNNGTTRSVTINGLQGSVGTHDVTITVTGPDGGVQNYQNTITFN